MRDSKFGLRAFGLALMAALGLMAFSAVAAQAEALSDGGKAGLFLVKKEGALVKLGVTFEGIQIGVGILLVPTRVDILCQVGEAEGEFHNDTDALVVAEFTLCSTWAPVGLKETHKTKINCTVREPIIATALALPKKHEGESFVLFEPREGVNFTTIFFEGPECVLPKVNPVSGSVVALIDNNDTVEPLLLFSEEIQKLFQVGQLGDHLKLNNFEAYIDSDVTVRLTDPAHFGMTLGVS